LKKERLSSEADICLRGILESDQELDNPFGRQLLNAHIGPVLRDTIKGDFMVDKDKDLFVDFILESDRIVKNYASNNNRQQRSEKTLF
jgi:hypothetical protein